MISFFFLKIIDGFRGGGCDQKYFLAVVFLEEAW